MPASSGLSNNMGTSPTQFAWNGEPGKTGLDTVPPPEAPYVALATEVVEATEGPYAYASEINAYIVDPLNDLITWARSVGYVKKSADQ